MWLCPRSFSQPFCYTSWSMAFYLSSSPFYPTVCRLAAVISLFFLWLDLTHLSIIVEFKISKAWFIVEVLFCEDLRYLLKYGLWRQYALVAEVLFYIDIVQELHASTTSSILDFGLIRLFYFSSLVHCVNSPNATTLHSRCIWEGVLKHNSQGH